jgi:hypothetical protein
VPRRGSRGDPPAGSFRRATHLDHRYVCIECSAVVENWRDHQAWHTDLDGHDHAPPGQLEAAGDLDVLTARARAEGGAEVAYASSVRRVAAFWAHAWLEAVAVLRVRAPRPALPPGPEPAAMVAGRAALARMRDSGLIARTTGKA